MRPVPAGRIVPRDRGRTSAGRRAVAGEHADTSRSDPPQELTRMPATSRTAAPSRTPSRSARRAAAATRPFAPSRRHSFVRRATAQPAEILQPSDARTLRALFGERLVLPTDAAFEAGRMAHNLAFDKRPAAIV